MDAKQAGKVMQAHRNRRKLTQDEVSAQTGVPSAQYLSALENGRYDVRNSEHFQALVTLYGLTAEQVREIHPGAILEIAAPAPTPPTGGTRKLLHTDKVEILVFAMASATPEGNCSEQPPSTTTLVSPRYARPNHCAYLVDGDSMDGGERPIRHGDVVVVDRGLRDLVDNRIYVVKVHGNGILLKRVRLYDGVPELQSDNRAHRTLRPDEAQILGMVVKVVPQEFDPY